MPHDQPPRPTPSHELESIARLAAAAVTADATCPEGIRLAGLIDYGNVIRFLFHQRTPEAQGLVTVLVGHLLELGRDRPGGRDAALIELERFIDDPALDADTLAEYGASWLDAGGGTLVEETSPH